MDKANTNTRSAPRAAWPVAVTKTLIPEPYETAIIRPRVRDIVLGPAAARLTLVCAPAGYGKTTLLAAMARTLPLACAWYTLDEIDGDPRMLLLGLSHAVAALAPAAGPALQGMLAGQPARRGQWRPLADTLINALTAQAHAPALLVLDDYHLIDDTPARGVVAHLIAQLPPGCRLVVATRTEPGFPLARLRATGAVRDVGPAALAFGPPEVADLLRRHSGVEPAPATVAQVLEDTAGWPLGVRLLLARQDSPAVSSELERDPVRDADDFFAAEVLRDVPAEVEQFLLATCLLERFSLELLVRGAVATREQGRRALDYLRRRHLFVEALDAEETWYRYHPLFAEMLRRTLREREGATGLARRRRACADGCAAIGETAQAIAQYLAAGAHEQAAALLEEHGQRLLYAGAALLVDSWLKQLPPALRERPPVALLTGMTAFHQGHLTETLRDLRRITGDAPAFGYAMFLMAGTLGSLGRYHEALQVGRFSLKHLTPRDPWWGECLTMTAAALDHLNHFAEADHLYHRAQESPLEATRVYSAVSEALFHMLSRGQLRGALLMAERGIAALGGDDPSNGRFYGIFHLGIIYLAAGQWEQAIARIQQLCDIAAQIGHTPARAVAHVALARIALARGRRAEAAACLAAAEDLRAGQPLMWEPYWLHVVRGRLAAQDGDSARANAELSHALTLVRDSGFWPEVAAVILEIVPDLPAGSVLSPWELLDEALAVARQLPNPLLEGRALLHMAAQCTRGGLPGDAAAHRRAAQELCAEHGYPHYLRDREPLLWAELAPELPRRVTLTPLARAGAVVTDARVGSHALSSAVAAAVPARDARTHANGAAAEPPARAVATAEPPMRARTSVAEPPIDAVPPGPPSARDADAARANGAAAIAASGLTITTLGDFALARAGRPVTARDWDRRKVRELFLYLVTSAIAQPGQPRSRDELIETFWPDLALPAAQQSLDVALSRLRHVLEPDRTAGHASRYLGQAAGCYTLLLGPDDALDAVTFRRAARAALAAQREDLLARAAELYGGAYLPEARYAPWAEAVRDELATVYLDLLAALATQRAALADWAGAISWTQQTLREDPSREEAHRRLIRYYTASGQRDRALRQYRLCRVQLLSAVGTDPSVETTDLYDRLREA